MTRLRSSAVAHKLPVRDSATVSFGTREGTLTATEKSMLLVPWQLSSAPGRLAEQAQGSSLPSFPKFWK